MSNTTSSYRSLTALLHSARPRTPREKLLVGFYWRAICLKDAPFKLLDLHHEMIAAGHRFITGSDNSISKVRDRLLQETPVLIEENIHGPRRRSYDITADGVREVMKLINRP